MADLLILALTVFTFQTNTKIAINIHLLEIFALLLVFSYQFTANCLSLPPPLLGGAISKPLTLPFALAFRTSDFRFAKIFGFSDIGSSSTRTVGPVSNNIVLYINQFTLFHPLK